MFRTVLNPVAKRVRRLIKDSVNFDPDHLISIDQQVQRSIVNQYALSKQTGVAPYSDIKDAGFRVYSQFEEDGIILYVLSMIGFKTRRVVEMCCGDGTECMATNLILNHGFEGFLFDGSESKVCAAKAFFAGKKDCLLYQPFVTHAWITAENVNDLNINAGCKGEIDLLSLDMDGNDYWIFKALDVVQPRLIIAECNNVIPTNRSLTIEYDPNFTNPAPGGHFTAHAGMSALAMQKLCKQRGYRMIGAHRHGFNVLFLKSGEGEKFFPEVSIGQVHDNHWTRLSHESRWPKVKDMPWQEV
jgi:hypothetical protein